MKLYCFGCGAPFRPDLVDLGDSYCSKKCRKSIVDWKTDMEALRLKVNSEKQ